ncbi:potassium-transporting ATPase subunit F [Leucobacter aridicollis]|nr:potassium-transporting ATPase subunit F [Leucobacter aridicollis]MCS3427708.1 K+-transporting ATPase KdpF subunit [Leucobacter aridicollis]
MIVFDIVAAALALAALTYLAVSLTRPEKF